MNAEGDAVITASFGESSVSVQVTSAPAAKAARAAPQGQGTARGEARAGLARPAAGQTEAAPVPEPVDARSVYVLRGRRGLDRGKRHDRGRGMQDGNVSSCRTSRRRQDVTSRAALALSVLLGFNYGLIRYKNCDKFR